MKPSILVPGIPLRVIGREPLKRLSILTVPAAHLLGVEEWLPTFSWREIDIATRLFFLERVQTLSRS
jgi:hypothetical protein